MNVCNAICLLCFVYSKWHWEVFASVAYPRILDSFNIEEPLQFFVFFYTYCLTNFIQFYEFYDTQQASLNFIYNFVSYAYPKFLLVQLELLVKSHFTVLLLSYTLLHLLTFSYILVNCNACRSNCIIGLVEILVEYCC